MNEQKTIKAEPVVLIAADGYRLAATLYPAQGTVKAHVLLAGAMLKVPNHVAMLEQQYKLFSAPAPGEDASEDPPRKWVRFP